MVQGELLIKPHLLSSQPFRPLEKDHLDLFLINPNLSEILNAVSITSFFNVSWTTFFVIRKAGPEMLIAATAQPSGIMVSV
jgi:hypothetical protein